jgi:hypothetical protein
MDKYAVFSLIKNRYSFPSIIVQPNRTVNDPALSLDRILDDLVRIPILRVVVINIWLYMLFILFANHAIYI